MDSMGSQPTQIFHASPRSNDEPIWLSTSGQAEFLGRNLSFGMNSCVMKYHPGNLT